MKDKENQKSFEERRAHPRYNVHYLADLFLGTDILNSSVIDISEGGIGIIFPSKFFQTEKLNLRINCNIIDEIKSELKKINIYLRAKNIWMDDDGKLFRAGLSITDIDGEDLIRLKDHIIYLCRLSDDQPEVLEN